MQERFNYRSTGAYFSLAQGVWVNRAFFNESVPEIKSILLLVSKPFWKTPEKITKFCPQVRQAHEWELLLSNRNIDQGLCGDFSVVSVIYEYKTAVKTL